MRVPCCLDRSIVLQQQPWRRSSPDRCSIAASLRRTPYQTKPAKVVAPVKVSTASYLPCIKSYTSEHRQRIATVKSWSVQQLSQILHGVMHLSPVGDYRRLCCVVQWTMSCGIHSCSHRIIPATLFVVSPPSSPSMILGGHCRAPSLARSAPI